MMRRALDRFATWFVGTYPRMRWKLDVLVTHGPPYGFGDRAYYGRRVGCADLLARVREARPSLHLFGHIHQDRGRWVEGETVFANVTTDEGTHPASVFDVAPRAAATSSAAVSGASSTFGHERFSSIAATRS